MKTTLFLLAILSTLMTFAQDTTLTLEKKQDHTVKDEKFINKFFTGKPRKEHNNTLGSISSQMSSTYHSQNTNALKPQKHDFGSSKYDKDILWSTDIDENDIQGSLNRYRKQRQEEELQPYYYTAIGILIIFLVFSVYYFNKNN